MLSILRKKGDKKVKIKTKNELNKEYEENVMKHIKKFMKDHKINDTYIPNGFNK